MDNKVKMVFEQIHADDPLKEKTRKVLCERMRDDRKIRGRSTYRFAVAACALILLFAAGGYVSYTIPVAAVSIDINPSVELQVNLYGRVIDVQAYNDDGTVLAEGVSVDNSDYTDAISSILDSEKIQSCLAADGLLEITVASGYGNRAEEMRECISEETGIDAEHIYCLAHREEVEEAHSAGISFGKYRAYLELHEMHPEITIEDIHGLTMREIRDMAREQAEDSGESGANGSAQGNGQKNGQGNGKQHRHGHEDAAE